ncbi:tRNA (adenosine(37)-N6)-methyltransferase TrmM, partial [Enterobacter quasiroggenkampii]|nr:tRNA (adenosine(37)-N6)-methyltransferase TrmM [Enterobacter quasiroggenkampii]
GHQMLIVGAAECSAEEGLVGVVMREQIGKRLRELALSRGWHVRLRTEVAQNEGRLPRRGLLAVSPQAGECFSDRLVIRGPDQNYSEAYTALTQAFYLFM